MKFLKICFHKFSTEKTSRYLTATYVEEPHPLPDFSKMTEPFIDQIKLNFWIDFVNLVEQRMSMVETSLASAIEYANVYFLENNLDITRLHPEGKDKLPLMLHIWWELEEKGIKLDHTNPEELNKIIEQTLSDM